MARKKKLKKRALARGHRANSHASVLSRLVFGSGNMSRSQRIVAVHGNGREALLVQPHVKVGNLVGTVPGLLALHAAALVSQLHGAGAQRVRFNAHDGVLVNLRVGHLCNCLKAAGQGVVRCQVLRARSRHSPWSLPRSLVASSQEVVGQVGVKGVVFTQGRITRYILSIKKTCP